MIACRHHFHEVAAFLLLLVVIHRISDLDRFFRIFLLVKSIHVFNPLDDVKERHLVDGFGLSAIINVSSGYRTSLVRNEVKSLTHALNRLLRVNSDCKHADNALIETIKQAEC